MQTTVQRAEAVSLWRQAIRHKWHMLIAFLVVLSVAALITALMPLQFTSEAKIFVRLGRESVGLDPTATTGQFVAIQETRSNEINSVVDLFKSQTIREQVVEEVGPEALVDDGSRLLASIGSVLDPVNLNPFRVYSDRDEAIQLLDENLLVESTRRSNIVTLSCDADSPKLAQQLLQGVIKHARESHIQANRTVGSRLFFEEQSSLLKRELEQAEDNMLAFKNEQRLADPVQQREIYLDQVGRLQADLLQAQSDLAGADVEVLTMRQSIQDVSGEQLLETSSGMPLRAASEMRANLYELELKEKELASKYTEDHFQLRQIRPQILAARTDLTEESQDPQVIKGITESRGGLEQMMFDRTARAASLKAKVETLERQAQETQAEMDLLNRNEVEFARLQREVDLASVDYLAYAEKLEQTRIDEELSRENISNINVLQEPTISETPTSPRVKLNLAVGLFLAVMAALAFPLAAGATVVPTRDGPQPLRNSTTPRMVEQHIEEAPSNDGGQEDADAASRQSVSAPR